MRLVIIFSEREAKESLLFLPSKSRLPQDGIDCSLVCFFHAHSRVKAFSKINNVPFKRVIFLRNEQLMSHMNWLRTQSSCLCWSVQISPCTLFFENECLQAAVVINQENEQWGSFCAVFKQQTTLGSGLDTWRKSHRGFYQHRFWNAGKQSEDS